MLIIKENDALTRVLEIWKAQGDRIGFVPTMGALHEGHLSLITLGKSRAERTVCSIFVNPTQFNDPGDLLHYPRTLAADIDRLIGSGCDLLYIPSVRAVYPDYPATFPTPDPGNLITHMEGPFRPGHFEGVMMVVQRLLDLVRPDLLLLGQKDYQQAAVVRFMLKKNASPVALLIGPTIRDQDGLALSSRNVRLSPAGRLIAPSIYQTLTWLSDNLDRHPPRVLEQLAAEHLEENGLRPEYITLADGHTLQPVEDPGQHQLIIACVAAWAGKVRLIDNLIIRGSLQPTPPTPKGKS